MAGPQLFEEIHKNKFITGLFHQVIAQVWMTKCHKLSSLENSIFSVGMLLAGKKCNWPTDTDYPKLGEVCPLRSPASSGNTELSNLHCINSSFFFLATCHAHYPKFRLMPLGLSSMSFKTSSSSMHNFIMSVIPPFTFHSRLKDQLL